MNNRKNSQDQKNDYVEGEFSVEILDGFECPVTMDIMVDPVMAADGHSYEEEAIKQWLKEGRRVSPMTGEKLAHTLLTPNHALRKAIQAFLKQRPGLAAIKKELHARRSLEQQMKDLRIAIQLREDDLAAQAAKKPKEPRQAAHEDIDKNQGEQEEEAMGFLQSSFNQQPQPAVKEQIGVQHQRRASLFAPRPGSVKPEEEKHAAPLDQARVEKFIKLIADGQQDEAEALLKEEPLLALTYGKVIDKVYKPFKRITAFQYALFVLDAHMWDMMVPYFTAELCQLAYEQLIELETRGIEYGKEQNWDKLTDEMKKYSDNYAAWNHHQCVQQLEVIAKEQRKLPQHVISEYERPDRPFAPVPPFDDGVKLPRGKSIILSEQEHLALREYYKRDPDKFFVRAYNRNSTYSYSVRWVTNENFEQIERDQEALLELGRIRHQQKDKLSQCLREKSLPQLLGRKSSK